MCTRRRCGFDGKVKINENIQRTHECRRRRIGRYTNNVHLPVSKVVKFQICY